MSDIVEIISDIVFGICRIVFTTSDIVKIRCGGIFAMCYAVKISALKVAAKCRVFGRETAVKTTLTEPEIPAVICGAPVVRFQTQ